MDLDTLVGTAAAALCVFSRVPQLRKCWETQSAGDLSLKMLLMLVSGVVLWIGYGLLKGDAVLVASNAVTLCLVSGILWFRLRQD